LTRSSFRVTIAFKFIKHQFIIYINNMGGNVPDLVIEMMVLDTSGVMKGRTRLQNTMFLLKEKYGIPISLYFESCFYGPYSEELAHDIEVLKAFKAVKETRIKANNHYEHHYKLTSKGKGVLRKLLENDEELRKIYQKIKTHVEEINKIPLKELIAAAKALLTTSSSL